MKHLTIRISRCFACPYLRRPHDDKVSLDWCYLAGKLVENINTVPIPDWCQLPDEEKTNDN